MASLGVGGGGGGGGGAGDQPLVLAKPWTVRGGAAVGAGGQLVAAAPGQQVGPPNQ